jgi:hypothetical protein
MNMNKDQYLPNDFKQALAEHKSVWTCLSRIEEAFVDGNLQEAKLTTCDLLNSLNELEKLQAKKKRHDELEAVVKVLASKGILIGLVKRK